MKVATGHLATTGLTRPYTTFNVSKTAATYTTTGTSPWYAYLYLAVDAAEPGLWRLADRLPEEGWQRRGTYTGRTRRRETATKAI
ncbi:hypothetical protein [Pyrobaculum sp.]|uniref:hypothetical protein n=1 Tax=Pyrobaculum sp. TaxID=2004705 RepID=UPI003D12AAC3